MIDPGLKFELRQLYRVKFRIKQKALELHQYWVEETRLNYMAFKIVRYRKKAAACCLQLEKNLAKKKEAVNTLVSIIQQIRQNNTIAFGNEKKLKKNKLSKRRILSHTMRNSHKPSSPL